MKIIQKRYSTLLGWEVLRRDSFDLSLCNLVFVFGSRELLSDPELYAVLQKDYPLADIVLNSTSGEIVDTQVTDNTIVLTAILFEKSHIKAKCVAFESAENSLTAGKNLARLLEREKLKHVMVISDGHKVNGSDLVEGLREELPKEVVITGGLAGDGAGFTKTAVGLNETPTEGKIVAIGFYGDHIHTSFGSVGGWGPFGPERRITRSNANVLYELDGKPALDIYKLYLGEYAKELPGSGLLFPISIRDDDSNRLLVRTILGINEHEKSLRFAGNMPEGSYARLMKANFDKLIEGASDAAQNSMNNCLHSPDLAILISCIGRKLVLNQRIEEEIEIIRSIYGDKTAISGFYSYGEISPPENFAKCELHNQTMTVTTFTEKLP